MPLLTLHDSLSLDQSRANALYARHLNPGLFEIYRALGMDSLDIESAEGVEIRLRGGRTVLDFSGALGVLGLGHNHPRIIAAERLCHDRKVVDAIKVGPTRLQAALAYNLSQMLPPPLEVCFFSVSGAEAVEAGMKVCEKAQGTTRRKFLTMSRAYHGKTHGALSVTTSGGFRRGFLMGIPAENVVEVEYGDFAALDRAIREHRNSLIAALVEPIQGESIRVAPPGFLKHLAETCRANGVLVIFDEVKVGMGRTGTFCAFQAEPGVVPDVVTLSKSLGGGKRAIGAMVCTRQLFDRAYGNRKDAALHTSTFSGLGESCAVAIETLNVYQDESLLDRCVQSGELLRAKLKSLMAKHPSALTEIRGRGLFQGIRFDFGKSLLSLAVDPEKIGIFGSVSSLFMASILRALFEQHGILAHFAASCPDVLHLMPPLIVEKAHIDRLVAALDAILSRGLTATAAEFVKSNVIARLLGAFQD